MSLTTLMSLSELVLQDSVPEYCRSILCQALACSFEGLALTRNPNQKDIVCNNEMKTFIKFYFQFQLKCPLKFSRKMSTEIHPRKRILVEKKCPLQLQ